jgi:hypothetical protein
MNHRFHLFATGTNGGLTLAALAETLHQINWQNALTVLFGALTTGVSWYVSARQAKREQDRLDREDARHQRLEDILQEIRIRKAEADPASLTHATTLDPQPQVVAGTTVGVAGSS